jgi:hypothetical protein
MLRLFTKKWIKISKPAFHFLFQELFAFIYWRIKYFKLKYGLSLYGVYIGIWLFVLYHNQKYLLFIKVPHYQAEYTSVILHPVDGTLTEYMNTCVTIFGNNQKRNTHFVTI